MKKVWIDVFRAGKYPQGDWTGDDLQAVADNYDPSYHEAPITIGHPSDNSPSYGWVRAVKRVGPVLKALVEPTVAAFVDWVRRGLYKTRSVSLYRDLDGRGPYLRHVGFLGAKPPAVKGLAPATFAAEGEFEEFEFAEATEIDFDDGPLADKVDEEQRKDMYWKLTSALRDIFENVMNGDAPTADLDGALDEFVTKTKALAGGSAPDTTEENMEELAKLKADLSAREAELAAATGDKTKLQAEFDETKRKHEELVATRDKERAAARRKEIHTFTEKGLSDGKLLPRWLDAGLERFIEKLPDGETDALEFAEAGEKVTPRAWFEKFLESLPAVIDFKRVAAKEKTSPARADEFEEEGRAIAQTLVSDKGGA